MPTNLSLNGIHAQRLKAIRSYVDFDYDLRKPLTKYQKSKIKKYFNEIDALTARPYQVYRPRTKDHLKKAQDFAQHEKRLPGLKVAFIPTNGKDRARIRFDSKGNIETVTNHITTRGLSLNTDALLKDPIKHVNQVIKKEPHAKRFSVLCGRFEIPVTHSRETVAGYVAFLTGKYTADKGNHFHGNWLHGLAAHYFTDQSSFNDYMTEKQAAKKELQRKRRNALKRAKRARNKK